MSPFGFLGGDQWISKTLAPVAFTVGGSRLSGMASKVRTKTPSPTPHPSTRRKIDTSHKEAPPKKGEQTE